MLRSGRLLKQSQRQIRCVHDFSAAATAARLSGDPWKRSTVGAHGCPQPHMQQQRQRHQQQQTRQLHLRHARASSAVGEAIMGRCRSRDKEGQEGALAYGGLGSRRGIWTPFNRGPKGDSGGDAAGRSQPGGIDADADGSFEGFSETTGAGGDAWTPPPDAWKPEDTIPPAEATLPQDPMSGFDAVGGFTDPVSDAAGGGGAQASEAVATAAATMPPDAVAAAAEAGLSAADLILYYPHHLCMKVIEAVHTTAGVPYWEAIVITSLVARIAVLPAFVTFQGMAKRMNIARVEMEPLQAKMNDIKARVEANPEVREAGQQEMAVVFYQIQDLLRKHRISYPTMLMCMLGQIPVFISLFLATQEMGKYFPGYATGGLEWVSNLAAPDPTYVLPVVTCSTMIIMMEIGGDVQPPQRDPSKPQPVNMKNVFRAMSLIFVPVAFSMPAGVLVYWSTTNTFGLVQRGAFSVPAVQKLLGWPLPGEMPGYSSSSRASGSSEKSTTEGDDSVSKDDLERWGGGRDHVSSDAAQQQQQQAAATEAVERARSAIAEESKILHEELKRQHAERSHKAHSPGNSGSGLGDPKHGDRRE